MMQFDFKGSLEFQGKRGSEGWPMEGPIDDPLVARLAEKYERTPAQVLLRHLVQRGIVVVPKSIKAQRLKENFQVLSRKYFQSWNNGKY
jgi:diketogulonate reductase-like aldo/keto reductase